MRIAVMGAGAIGAMVGGTLAEAGEDVLLIDQWPDHVEAMKRRGLRISGTYGDRMIPVRALHLHEVQAIEQPVEAVFLAVKGYDTDWATMFGIRLLREPDGVIVDFQNGIHDERVAAIAGRHRTLGCVVTIGGGVYEPGHAVRTDPKVDGRVCLKVGELDGRATPRAQGLAQILAPVGLTLVTTNLWGDRWSKLASNAMGNALAGLTGYAVHQLRADPRVRKLSVQIGAEAVRVSRAAGYQITPVNDIDPQRLVDAAEGRGAAALDAEMAGPTTAAGSDAQPSLLQDVMRRRRTEIDELNGYIVAEGRRLGVPTPFNEAVVGEVKRHGVGRLESDPKHIDSLARMLPS